jgi:plasmid replication initiation protein
LQVNWLSSAEYLKGGVVELEVSQKLRPYLLQLKEHFTKYQLRQIAKLKSSFSIRIYELCKCHEYKGGFEIKIDDLKRMFGLEAKYKLYGDLKRKVLLVAKNEINETTDITIDLLEVKAGKRVDAIQFFVKPKPKDQEDEYANSPEAIGKASANKLVGQLVSLGVAKKTAQTIARDYDEKRINDAIALCDSQQRKGKIKNPGGFIVEAIKNEYRDNQAEEQARRQTIEKAKQDEERQAKELIKKAALQKKQAIEGYLNSLTQEQFQLLEADFIEAYKADALVMQRYHQQGLNNPVVKGCFGSFVLKKLPQVGGSNAGVRL